MLFGYDRIGWRKKVDRRVERGRGVSGGGRCLGWEGREWALGRGKVFSMGGKGGKGVDVDGYHAVER